MKKKNTKKKQATTFFAKGWLNSISFLSISKWITAFLCLSGFGWIYLSMTDYEQFPVKHVQIEGEYPHIDKKILKQTIMPHVLNGFFLTKINELGAEIKQIPWVAEAKVSRVWPDKITVSLKEWQPLCRWNDNALLSTQHALFYPPQKTMPHNLPTLKGPEGLHIKVLEGYYVMQQLLEPLGLSIMELELDKRHAWQMRLSNGMRVVIGKNHYQDRLKQFVSSYQKIFETRENAVNYVDLRYKHGMAVKWKTMTQLA